MVALLIGQPPFGAAIRVLGVGGFFIGFSRGGTKGGGLREPWGA